MKITHSRDELKRLAVLFELKEAISRSMELDEILKTSLDKTIGLTNMDGGVIYLLDKNGELVIRVHEGLTGRFLRGVKKMKTGEGITGSVPLTGEIEIVRDLSIDPRTARHVVKEYKVRGFASIPLGIGDKILGVMNVYSHRVVRSSSLDRKLLMGIGRQIGNAIYNATLYQRIQFQIERMRAISNIGLEISTMLNPLRILKSLPSYIKQLFQVKDYAAVFNKRIKKLKEYKIGDIRSKGFRRVRLSFNRSSLGRVIFESRPDTVITVKDYFNDKRFPVPSQKSDGIDSIRSIMGSRIEAGGDSIGIIAVGSKGKNAFDKEDIHIFKLLVSYLESAIGNSMVFQDLKDSYRRMIAAQRVIIKAEKIAALIRLTTQISHRIRNSLGAIQTSLDVLKQEDGISRDGKELLDVLLMENRKLNKLVNDFFEFAGPEGHSFEEVRVKEFLETTVNSYIAERSLETSNIRIMCRCDPRIQSIRLNPLGFAELLRRLLDNGIDAIPEKGGVLRVECRYITGRGRNNDIGEFIVKDNGCGIEPEIRSRVFEPFFTTKPSGNGLGLAIVERIASQHGGSVRIDSVKGSGTSVHVRIPLR